MAYTGLTTDQRARVEDAGYNLVNNLTAELRADDDTADDSHLRAVEILTVLLAVLDGDRVERVVALRWPDRDGGPIGWPRLQAPAGLGRGGPESRWGRLVAERAAAAAPSWYTPAAAAAASTAGRVGADA